MRVLARRLAVPVLVLLLGGTVASLPLGAIEHPAWDLRIRIAVNGAIQLHRRLDGPDPVRVPLRWNRFTADGGDPDFATWAELVMALELSVQAAEAGGMQREDLVIRFQAAPRTPWAAVDLCYQAAWDADVGLRNFEFSTRGRNTDVVASRDEQHPGGLSVRVAVDFAVPEGQETLRVDLRENAFNSFFAHHGFADPVDLELLDADGTLGPAAAVVDAFYDRALQGVPASVLPEGFVFDEFVVYVRPGDDVRPMRESPAWRVPARAMIDLWASLRRSRHCRGAYVLPGGVPATEWARRPAGGESEETSR